MWSCRGTPICLQTVTAATETSYDSACSLWGKLRHVPFIVVQLWISSLKRLSWKKSFNITLLSAVSHLLDSTVISLKNKKRQTFPHFNFFFFGRKMTDVEEKHVTFDLQGNKGRTRSLQQGYALYSLHLTWLPYHTHKHVRTHTSSTRGLEHMARTRWERKNMTQMISMVRDEQWLEKKQRKTSKKCDFFYMWTVQTLCVSFNLYY